MSSERREGGVRTASAADVDWLLTLAAAEGWNPGLEDAIAFRAADPEGFVVALDGGRAVAGIAVVRPGSANGFLGLYLCAPEARGRGHGWRVWQAGLARLGERTVGLDGVVEQQANYRRSGFAFAWRNVRFAGAADLREGTDGALRVRPAAAGDLAAMVALDRVVGGVDRERFLGSWFASAPSRCSFVCERQGRLVGLGTVRECREHAKVGPLIADEPDTARALLAALAAHVPGDELVIDVPERNAAAVTLARQAGLVPVFETARMYRGTPPRVVPGRLYGVATLELG